ncbi:MAG: hypothetical protein ACPIOQ_66805, partial [Promethearchaeia archaeon]
MSTDQRADREEVKDVQYTHVAQVQELQSAFPIALTDQPSNLHCFQLEFPLDDDNTSPKTSVLARGNPDPDSNEPRRITLAAHSAEERDKWLGALNLFCKLTAAERARASRSAAFQKQLRKKAREQKLDDMEIGHALASTADPTPHAPKTTTTSKCLFPAQLAQATDVQDVVPNQDGIPVFEEPAEKQTGDGTSESLTSGENSAVAGHPEAVLKPTLGTFPTSQEAVVVAEAWQAPEDSFMISDVFRGMPIEHRRPTSAVPWRPTSPAIRKQQPMRPTSASWSSSTTNLHRQHMHSGHRDLQQMQVMWELAPPSRPPFPRTPCVSSLLETRQQGLGRAASTCAQPQDFTSEPQLGRRNDERSDLDA